MGLAFPVQPKTLIKGVLVTVNAAKRQRSSPLTSAGLPIAPQPAEFYTADLRDISRSGLYFHSEEAIGSRRTR